MQKAGHGNTEAGRRAWTRRAGGRAVRHGGGGRLAIGQAFAARGGLAGTRTMRAPMARRDCWSLHGAAPVAASVFLQGAYFVIIIRYLIQFDILWRSRSRLSFLIDLTAAPRES
ncbi:hypothetical protein L505_3541 [Bordetella bronchiseptica F4563]|nr:hypothetical protein L505_3541 [Bordetella bronchiseptica F4563]KDD96854.1 hypothetical protein L531_3304 [Bordetella bronchiseptica MO275]